MDVELIQTQNTQGRATQRRLQCEKTKGVCAKGRNRAGQKQEAFRMALREENQVEESAEWIVESDDGYRETGEEMNDPGAGGEEEVSDEELGYDDEDDENETLEQDVGDRDVA